MIVKSAIFECTALYYFKMDSRAEKIQQTKNTLQHLGIRDLSKSIDSLTTFHDLRQIISRIHELKYLIVRDIEHFKSDSISCFTGLEEKNPEYLSKCIEQLEAEKELINLDALKYSKALEISMADAKYASFEENIRLFQLGHFDNKIKEYARFCESYNLHEGVLSSIFENFKTNCRNQNFINSFNENMICAENSVKGDINILKKSIESASKNLI